LYVEGGEIGPDLTGYQRDQLQTLVRNIIAPSLEIREGYQTVVVRMEDGSVLTGFIENQNDEQITLKVGIRTSASASDVAHARGNA
jgi:putative heme-binding domain-containing protein